MHGSHTGLQTHLQLSASAGCPDDTYKVLLPFGIFVHGKHLESEFSEHIPRKDPIPQLDLLHMTHTVSFRKKPEGQTRGEQYPSKVEEHVESVEPTLQVNVQPLHTDAPGAEENIPAEQRVQLPSTIELNPEEYFPGLHNKQVLGNAAFSAVEYFPGEQLEQFTTAIRPDPVWYLPAAHHVQLTSSIRPDPVWYFPGTHHVQLP